MQLILRQRQQIKGGKSLVIENCSMHPFTLPAVIVLTLIWLYMTELEMFCGRNISGTCVKHSKITVRKHLPVNDKDYQFAYLLISIDVFGFDNILPREPRIHILTT